MQGQVLAFHRSLSSEEATQIVQSAVGTDRLGWSDHALQQMDDRAISNRIVMTTLSRGGIKSGPTWNDEHRDWVCVFQLNASGRNLRVVVGVAPVRREVSVITSY